MERLFPGHLQPGEPVKIVAVKGSGVVVEPANNGRDELGNVM